MYSTDLYVFLNKTPATDFALYEGELLKDMSDLTPSLIKEMQPGDSCIFVDKKTWSSEGRIYSPFVELSKTILDGKITVRTYRIPYSLSMRAGVVEREEHTKRIEEYYKHFSSHSWALWHRKEWF